MSAIRQPAVHMDVETYRNTPFENPEPHFLDGELEPRTLGEYSHSLLTARLLIAFHNTKWLGLPEIRIRITSNRIRTADVAIIPREPKPGKELTYAPAVFEILSPGQSIDSQLTHALFRDYASLAIPHLFVLDPGKHCWQWDYADGFCLYELPTIAIGDVSIKLADLWEGL